MFLFLFTSYYYVQAFNTFIDDLFAFIITMPTAHRMACFRDDIVFLVYLYQVLDCLFVQQYIVQINYTLDIHICIFQRWLYPVDHTRVNEFGERGESAGEIVEKEKVSQENEVPASNSTVKVKTKRAKKID